MTTTSLPPFPRPSVFDPGRFGVAYSQTQMVEFATQARADLEAEVQRLREALDWCIAEINRDSPAVLNARATLEKTK